MIVKLAPLIITKPNIVSEAIGYIKLYNNRTETDMRSWLFEQEYDNDYHYFETRLMTRENIIRKFNVINNEYVYYYTSCSK